MSIDATLDGSAVPVEAILLRSQANNGLTMASAADGVGSQGSVVFDDPGGSLDVQGWMPVTVDEPDCTTAPRLFTGYVYDRIYRRGPYKSGAARQIDTTLNDLNAVMSFRLIDGADGIRKVETDTARLAWILGSDYLSGLIADLGFVTPSGQNLDEEDFRGQYPADVINSCVLGRLFFAYWDQGVEACGLFFDLPDATTYTCTFSVSNVIADNSSTCLYPLLDAELDVSPDEVYSKVRLTYLSGTVVQNSPTTAATFFPSPVLTRGKQVTSTRIGRVATATAQAAIELARSAQEKKKLTFAIRVRSADVGLIDAGMRMSVRFTHLPGFETATYVRIQQRTLAPTESDRDFYDMVITASNLGLPVVGGGNPGDVPAPGGSSCDNPTNIALGKTVTASSLPSGHNPVNPNNLTDGTTATTIYNAWVAGAGTSYGYWTIDFGSPAQVSQVTLDRLGGWQSANTNLGLEGSATGSSWTALISQAEFAASAGAFDPRATVNIAPATYRYFRVVDSYTQGGLGFRPASEIYELYLNGCEAGDLTTNPPLLGQEWPWTVVAMTTVGGVSTGTAPFPYAPLSLKVKVDGVLISPASYVETNPTTGAFALTWETDPSETVTVSFQGI